MAKIVLAIDLATTTGFAFGAVGSKPTVGAIRFGRKPNKRLEDPGSSNDEIWAAAVKWLLDMIKVVKPNIVAIEAPVPMNAAFGHTTVITMDRLHGLQANFRMVVCTVLPTTAKLIHVQSARKLFIGKGNLPGQEAKQLVKARCIELGWLTEDNATFDKADACCVWAKQCANMDARVASQFTPLFANKTKGVAK